MKTAIVHYWLIGMRGGEKMLESLLELYPNADIFTHVFDPPSISGKIKSHKIITSSINKLPLAKKLYQLYMPLMPNALLEFDLQDYDLIISSEAGPAKGVVPAPGAYHICYCHSPMRYLWDLYHEYFNGAGFFKSVFMKLLIPRLRMWDITSANLVDRFITNSNYVAKRIKRYYRRDAEVVFGPAAIEDYISNERDVKDFYLFFGQITPNKHLDIALNACETSGRKLVVAGAGADKKILSLYRKSNLITFAGKISDAEAKKLFSQARALLYPGIEDMGLIPIEANAAGCPVIAYRKGGVLDTVKEGETGLFFDEQNPSSLIHAIEQFEKIEDSFKTREKFTAQVLNFSKDAFKERVSRVIAERKFV